MSAATHTSELTAGASRATATIAARIADFAAGFRPEDLPPPVIAHAQTCMLDAIGIALASTSYDFAAVVARGLTGLGGNGDHAVIGMPLRLSARDAALLNGFLIHGLDYDDTHSASVVHASASAFPVVLAEGIRRRVDGRRALAAYVLAIEIDARIGLAAGGEWQNAGFHPTGVVGAFGAAVAAGYLSGLTAEGLVHAQGLVLSMAAGSMEFLDQGAWTKRLHPGLAAAAGITAAAFAQAGFIAPERAYEGRFGLFNSYLGARAPQNLDACTSDLGQRWETLKVALKPYPVCHFNHAFIDAALAIQTRHQLRPENIVKIVARIHPNQVQVVCEPEARKRHPQSDYDAKFSLHYAIACALVHGRFTLDELDPAILADPAVLALCERTSWEPDLQSAFPRYYSGEVVIYTRDGRELRDRQAANRGSDLNPLSKQDAAAKFLANAARSIAPSQAQRIMAAVSALPTADDLCELEAAVAGVRMQHSPN